MERSFSLFRLSTGEHSHARTESWKKREAKPPEPLRDGDGRARPEEGRKSLSGPRSPRRESKP